MAAGHVGMGGKIHALGTALTRAPARLLQPVLGSWSWEPPSWLRYFGRCRAIAFAWLRAHPRAGFALLAAILGAIAAGYAGWQWWEAQPRPVLVGFKVTEPGPMRLEDADARPEPLIVEFDASVAPLKDVGKEAGAGIALEPKVEGKWQWDGDKVLRFNPKAEWPVGTEFVVTLDRGLALAEQVRLSDYRNTGESRAARK